MSKLISVQHEQDHAGDRVILRYGNTVIDIADNEGTGGMTIEAYAYSKDKGELVVSTAGFGDLSRGTTVIEVFTEGS